MKLPPGYKTKQLDMVCHLQMSLYYLHQALRQWFNVFYVVMHKFGFEQSPANPTLFTKGTSINFVALLIYVDDIGLTGKSEINLDVVTSFL